MQNDGEPLSTQDQEVIAFLDSCQHRFGPKSLLYIRYALLFLNPRLFMISFRTCVNSFGSVFFPGGRPDMVRALINSLLTASPPVPFLFALAGCPADLAAELSALLKGNDLALVSPFVPQMNVLRHPATGWFLVSVSECVCLWHLVYLDCLGFLDALRIEFDERVDADRDTSCRLAYQRRPAAPFLIPYVLFPLSHL